MMRFCPLCNDCHKVAGIGYYLGMRSWFLFCSHVVTAARQVGFW